MISKQYGYIYIHVPKTGGNSVQSALAPYSDDRVVWRRSVGHVVSEDGLQGLDVFNESLGFVDPAFKHASLADYRARLGELGSYLIVASVRNPWDRVISRTAFRREDGLADAGVLPRSALSLPQPMVDYLTLDGRVVVDQVIRFERMQEDFARLCERLGLPPMTLPHKNASVRRDYREYYDEDTIRYVADIFRADIEHFGYSFD